MGKSVTSCIFNNHNNSGHAKDFNLATIAKPTHSCRRNLVTLIMKGTIIGWCASERECKIEWNSRKIGNQGRIWGRGGRETIA